MTAVARSFARDSDRRQAENRCSLVGQVSSPIRAIAEEGDPYPVIVQLNARWRVIACRSGIQWILQKRRGANRWRGVWFCRTRSVLVAGACRYANPIHAEAMIVLLRLPARFDGGAP
jgi:hypothetical protein